MASLGVVIGSTGKDRTKSKGDVGAIDMFESDNTGTAIKRDRREDAVLEWLCEVGVFGKQRVEMFTVLLEQLRGIKRKCA